MKCGCEWRRHFCLRGWGVHISINGPIWFIHVEVGRLLDVMIWEKK